AEALFSEGLEIMSRLGAPFWIANTCNNLGSARFQLGDCRRARVLHRTALERYRSLDNLEGVVWSLERLAVVEATDGDAQEAARLLGAASVGREGLGKPLDRWDQEDWDAALASARAALGEAAFASLWAEGRALTLDQAVASALTPA